MEGMQERTKEKAVFLVQRYTCKNASMVGVLSVSKILPFEQVYGSVVANRYSNQHILPLSQMSVSAECFYQPRVNADFDEDSEQMELGLFT